MIKRILYTSLVDVSIPYGPGVNERGFLSDMLERFGDDFCAVIPTPSRGMPHELEALKVRLIPAWGSVRRPLGWILARSVGCAVLPRTITRFRPDLIVMRIGALPLPHLLAARMFRVPYALKTAAGDVTGQAFYDRHVLRRTLRPMNSAMSRSLLYGAVCIDLVSDDQRKAVTEAYPALRSRVHVVDNGVDLGQFQEQDGQTTRSRMGFSEEDIVIGYAGTAPMKRGGKEVVDAVADLRSYPVKGLIVGDSGQAGALKDYAMAAGVAESVIVYGEADYALVPNLMAAMDVGLSVRRPEERGASELKVRQYLASGLCVVGTTGSNDFLRGRKFARVVDTNERNQVVAAVASFVDMGREGLSTLGREARTFAQRELSIAAKTEERMALWTEGIEDSLRSK